jgi:hypothetical protein
MSIAPHQKFGFFNPIINGWKNHKIATTQLTNMVNFALSIGTGNEGVYRNKRGTLITMTAAFKQYEKSINDN